jgi:hypothetical protein
MKIDIPSHLSDDDLVAAVKSLARSEREATASLIAHLAELLTAATGKSKRQVEELLVLYFPQPAVPSSMRRLSTIKPSSGSTPARNIAAKVRRAVWLRDRGDCTFVSKSGRRCNERGFIQFHHVDPQGVGGEATVANIHLRCSAHNAYEGVLFYGHGRPPERVTRPGKSSSSPPP